MTAVWYIGAGDRSISAAAWAAAGVAGAADTSWSAGNGWSLPASGFTSPQLTILAADGAFNINAADGPRPGPGGGGSIDQSPATQAFASSVAVSAVAAQAVLDKVRRRVDNNRLYRYERRERRLGPVTTDITSATAGVTADGTLTNSYAWPGLASGSGSRLLTAPEYDALAISPGPSYMASSFRSAGVNYLYAGYSPQTPKRSIRFMTDAPKVQVLLWNTLAPMTYQVFVDDAPFTLARRPTPAPCSTCRWCSRAAKYGRSRSRRRARSDLSRSRRTTRFGGRCRTSRRVCSRWATAIARP